LQESIVGIPETPFAVDLGPPVISYTPGEQTGLTAYLVEFDRLPKDTPTITTRQGDIYCAVPNPRVDGKAYVTFLTDLKRQIDTMGSVIIRPVSQSQFDAARRGQVTTGLHSTELVAARKVIIPIVVALICSTRAHVDKSVIADELHKLVSLWPDGNPPRAALKRVNEVLLSRDSQ
jgi:tRNA A64-2'-O-ribosylphosphate transferase